MELQAHLNVLTRDSERIVGTKAAMSGKHSNNSEGKADFESRIFCSCAGLAE